MPVAKATGPPAPCRQRGLQKAVFYSLVSEPLESFLRHVREVHGREIAPYVENEFRE